MIGVLLCVALLGQNDVRIETLIGELGSEDPADRDRAQQRLKEHPVSAYPYVRAALGSGDPEIRLRARGLLESNEFALERVAQGHVQGLGTDKVDEVVAAIGRLLSLDVARLINALELCHERTAGLMRFQAGQLRAILSAKSSDGLIYGVVLLKPATNLDEDMEAVEVWRNCSTEKRSFENLQSRYWITPIPSDLKTGSVLGWSSFSTCTYLDTFVLSGGSSRAVERKLTWRAPKSGPYTLATYYISDAAGKKGTIPKNLWTGEIKSNVIRFEIQLVGQK